MLATKTILKWNKLDSENTESSTAKTPVRILAINVEEEPPTTSQTDDYDEGGMTDTRGEASQLNCVNRLVQVSKYNNNNNNNNNDDDDGDDDDDEDDDDDDDDNNDNNLIIIIKS
uniref:Uncharacterized protein n=1 Tax=Vespula pensylvanica TaxID=30213 RepID=A0A834KVR4_VESPE|nr:hypothetical protein H0235_012931 [Vespula pensylvanica]